MSSDLLGLGGEVRWGERTLRLAPCTFKVQGHFERWLQREAWDAVEALRQDVPLGVYQLHASTWQQDCAAGLYDWGELACLLALSREKGQKQLLAILLVAGGNPLSREKVEALWADEGARAQVVGHLAGLVGRRPDPTPPGSHPGNGDGGSSTGSPTSSTTTPARSAT